MAKYKGYYYDEQCHCVIPPGQHDYIQVPFIFDTAKAWIDFAIHCGAPCDPISIAYNIFYRDGEKVLVGGSATFSLAIEFVLKVYGDRISSGGLDAVEIVDSTNNEVIARFNVIQEPQKCVKQRG